VKNALPSVNFERYSQPVLGLARRDLVQHEILARLIDESGRSVAAADFFPMVVRHGMAARLDKLILDRVIGQLARTPQMGETAVNVSATSIASGDFLNRLKSQLLARPAGL